MSTPETEIETEPGYAVVTVDPDQRLTRVPMTATCVGCGGGALREARWNGADLVLEPWRHTRPYAEDSHPVTQIFLGDS